MILDSPPKWTSIEKVPSGGTRVIYHRVGPLVYFLLPLTAFWFGSTMFYTYGAQIISGRFDLGQSLMGLLFVAVTLILLAVIVFCLFGRWVITLDRGDGTVFVGVGSLGWTRRFSYGRGTIVSIWSPTLFGLPIYHGGKPATQVLVQTDGGDFAFGWALPMDMKEFVAAVISRESLK
jgi:hypothetical protein